MTWPKPLIVHVTIFCQLLPTFTNITHSQAFDLELSQNFDLRSMFHPTLLNFFLRAGEVNKERWGAEGPGDDQTEGKIWVA